MRIAHLDEVLALGLGDERLQLRGSEGVDQASLRDDEKQHLGASEDRKLVCLRAKEVSGRGSSVNGVNWRMRRARVASRMGDGQSSRWVAAHLLHDASLALGEGDVAA